MSVPAIGDKAHQPSLFEATTTLITNSEAPVRPVGSHMATVDRARDPWLQIA